MMLPAFLIWSAVSAVFLILAAKALRSAKPAAFIAGIHPERVRDPRRYNRAVAILLCAYALVFEALGVPLLFLKTNTALIAVTLLGVPLSALGLMAAWHAVLRRMEEP